MSDDEILAICEQEWLKTPDEPDYDVIAEREEARWEAWLWEL